MVLRLSTFPADVRGTLLAGLSTASAAVISAADSVVAALGKLQAQTSLLSPADVGRNKLHNPLFNVAQRGAGPFTSGGVYGLDRWLCSPNGDTASFSPVSLGDTDRSAIGDEEAVNALQCVFTGTSTSTNYTLLVQRIENARRLSGKPIVVSFWAKCASGTLKFGADIAQIFGSGGSPSAAVLGNGTSVTLATTWARYSISLAVPSTAGKTFGTNGDSSTQLGLWYSAASGSALPSGSVGVQSGTVTLWGVQLEIGATATPLEKPDSQLDIVNCGRFYQTGQIYWQGSVVSGATYGASQGYVVPMRAIPTGTITLNACSGMSTPPTLGPNQYLMSVSANATATGGGALNVVYAASADL